MWNLSSFTVLLIESKSQYPTQCADLFASVVYKEHRLYQSTLHLDQHFRMQSHPKTCVAAKNNRGYSVGSSYRRHIYYSRTCVVSLERILHRNLDNNVAFDKSDFCLLLARVLWFAKHVLSKKLSITVGASHCFPFLKWKFSVSRVLQATQFGIHLCFSLSEQHLLQSSHQ